MRRIIAIAAALAATGLLVVLPAAGGDDDGPYLVRAIFDNGAFVVSGEEVRIAGARVGSVESVSVSMGDEVTSEGGQELPGKAIVVLKVDDDGFKDFREDASCRIRPQSLLGEKYVDCTPTQPRAPGSEPPPELPVIEDGEPGEGQRLLPVESNGTSVDIDLVQNINRLPYRERFRIILNELGAGVAGRGEDLGEVIDRANPALQQTDRVLAILAQQNQQLAALASNGDTVLGPLAREREHITGFMGNAAIAGQATAERSAELEAQFQRLPRFLRELRLTMRDLKAVTDNGTPLFADLGVSAKDLARITVNLKPFARVATPALTSLGRATQAAGPKLVAADPLTVDLTQAAVHTAPIARNLKGILTTFEQTNGIQNLLKFIRFSTTAANGFDSFGHFLRTNVLVTTCIDSVPSPFGGCSSNWAGGASSAGASAAAAEGKTADVATAKGLESAELTPPDTSEEIPELTQPPAATDETDEAAAGEEPATTEPVPGAESSKRRRQGRAMDMQSAQTLLEFLLGGSS